MRKIAILIVTVLTLNLLSACNPADIPKYAYLVSYAGFSDDNSIYNEAENKSLIEDDPETHLPIFKIETYEELVAFKNKFDDIFNMSRSYDEVKSFDDAMAQAQCDREIFFDEHSLLIVYVPTTSGTYRFGIKDIVTTDNSICIEIEETKKPEVIDCLMSGWFVVLKINDEEVYNYTFFDAVLN